MEENMASINGNGSSTTNCCHDGQTIEELKQLLACATMELKSTREAAKAQQQLHEIRESHWEKLLKTTRRERDESRDKVVQLRARFLASRSIGSGMSQETQLRPLSAVQPLESVASMSEPSRATLTEVHRKMQGQQQQLDLQKQLEYVSSMSEPTRDTLTEVHRKMQEQQQQHLEFQHMEMQHLQHGMDLQHQHSIHSQHDLRTSSTNSHLEYQSQHHQHQLDELRHHLEIQHKDHIQDGPLHMDIVIGERQAEVSHSEVDNGSDAKSTTWNEFPSGVHLEIHSSSDQCLVLDSPDHMHMKLTQRVPGPHMDQGSPTHLDDLQQQLQQQQQHHQQDDNMHLHLHQQLQHQHQHQHQYQHQQDDNMQLHLHQQQQESEQLLLHMQQGQTADSRSLHLQDEQPLRRQLSKHQDGLTPISGGLQGTNDGVMNMSVMQQHSSWPVGLVGLSSPRPSNGCQSGLSEQLLQTSCLQGGSVVASILSPLERFADSTSSSLLLPRPVHLPEPPEADPQVMLNSLPEKGKLLQAVMQAGPLLKTLLLAGPLPTWRHPPPALDAEDIPRVSMGAHVGIMPPHSQAIGLMANHGSNLEQVMLLSAPVQSSPSQNGFCH